jgi:alpha-galactosidase
VFQIDSGFEAKVGDWLESKPGFPQGVGTLAEEIRSKGMKPGLWLSPFIVHSGSKIARQHRDWLLRGRLGVPLTSSYVSNNLNKALDLTRPQALEHVCEIVRKAVEEWGYAYLKLDYLYAAGIKGRYRERTKTRAQVLRRGLEALRETVGPDVELLGCGVPLGSAIGIFDSVRIGPDVAPSWGPDIGLLSAILHFEPNLPSVRNALQNTITRAFFHDQLWVNDPDCLLVRPDANLSLAEVRTLATTIAFSGGSLLLSDDLTRLPGNRLKIVEQLLPLIGKRPRVLDWFDSPKPGLLRLDLNNSTGSWHLLAVFNWSRDQRDFNLSFEKLDLPPSKFFARDFWEGDTGRASDGRLVIKGIPPHGVSLLALRPVTGENPVYLGSSFHVSQGLEVANWSASLQDAVSIQVERLGKSEGVVDIYYPRTPQDVVCNQGRVEWEKFEDGILRLHLKFKGKANLEIR